MTGTGKLIRLILRRDRSLLPIWVVYTAIIPLLYVYSIKGLFPTEAGRFGYYTTSAHNAGFVALYGRLYGDSIGQLVAWRAGFIPIVIGLFSLLTVIRHTRTEEDSGRRELVASTVVGRHAGLAAAVVTTVIANLLLGAILAVSMVAGGQPAAGSVAFGAQFAVAGWVFTGVAAVAAQLTSGAGSARGIAITTLGVAYVLRVVGDISGIGAGTLSWLSWLSPIAWAQRIDPYGDANWWPAMLAVVVTALLVVVAGLLSARRDLGAGLLPPRLGPATGSMGSPLGLAWRLHRGLLAGWIGGFVALGVVLGYLADSVGDLVRDTPQLSGIFARIGGASGLIDSYLSSILGLLGLIAAGYGIQAMLRARAEETSGRVEPLLGTAVGRLRWVGSHLVFALAGPAVVLACAGVATGLAHGLNSGNVGRELPRILAGAMVQLPAVWVLTAVTVALFGLLPRLSVLGWAALVVCLLVGFVGPAIQLNHWVLDISPFGHLPKLPGGQVSATPLAWLLGVVLVLTAVGLVGLRRRDIPTT